MTNADELYLKKFLQARDLKDESKIEYTNIYEKQFIDGNKDGDKNGVQDGGTNVQIDINSRLFLERNRQFKPEQVSYIDKNGKKVTLTSHIFGEGRYFKQQEDTTQDPNMQDYVEGDWDASPVINRNAGKAATE